MLTSKLEIHPTDRVMVLAPHPDDESLATAGMLQRARALGARTRVLFVTDGENNPWPQRALEWRWRILAADRSRWGTRRRAEALSALSCLGVTLESVRFLGYPDQGLCDLLMTNPDPLLHDLVTEIATWRPSILIDPTPVDRHPDHGALAVLTDFALAQPALRNVRSTRLRYLVHGSLRSVPDGSMPTLDLSKPEQDRKRSAILMHRSQLLLGGPGFLRFARADERYLQVAHANAIDAGHNVTRCLLNRRDLHLTIGSARRVGIGPLVIQLAVVTEQGSTMRVSIPMPSRGEAVLPIPIGPNATPRMAYVKLDRPSERRLGFFDSMGWRSVPVMPAQHRSDIEDAAPRTIAVEPHEIPVP